MHPDRAHPYERPAPGPAGIPAPSSQCVTCGYGPADARHALPVSTQQARLDAADRILSGLRTQLATMVGEQAGRVDHILAYADGAAARALAALHGQPPTPYLVVGRRPAPPHQAALPVAA